MNIITELPVEIRDIIKPYVIGYKDTVVDKNGYKTEIWVGPKEYQTGTFRQWYPTGELLYEWSYREGKFNGLQRSWYNTGQLEYKFIYREGNPHGLERWWFPGGEIEYERNWNMGKLIW